MPAAPETPCVVLLHELPDGSSHFDWFTARSPAPGALLLSFRTTLRPDSPDTRAFSAESLPDHRAHYLTHEGPLEPADGHDRGTVRRLARGAAVIERADDTGVTLLAEWGGARLHYSGRPDGARWIFSVTPE